MARLDETKSTERLFSILHLFKAGTIMPYGQLALLLGESPEDAKRDLEILGTYEIDNEILHFITLDKDELPPDGGVFIMDDLPVLDLPLRLSPKESAALLAALDFAEGGTGELEQKLATSRGGDSAVDATDEGAGGPLSLQSGTVEQELLEELSWLCEKHHLAWLDYSKPEVPGSTRRLIEPLQLRISEAGIWYLDAYCRESEGTRTFRLDRIEAVEDATGHFQPRDDLDFPDHLADRPCAILAVPADEPFEMQDWPGATVLEEAGATEQGQGGQRRISVPYDGFKWIARSVLAHLGRIRVEEPTELQEAIREMAAELLADQRETLQVQVL